MTRLPYEFKGHDIPWSHLTTPRVCPGYYADRSNPDRWVFRACVVLAAIVVVLFSTGVIQ